MKNILLGLLLLFLFSGLLGQDQVDPQTAGNAQQPAKLPPVNPDRPTQTATAYAVPHKTLLIETGFLYETTDSPESNHENIYLGTTLLRYGLWERFELRLASYYGITRDEQKEPVSDTTISGFGPLTAGFKVHVVKEKGIRPKIAIIGEITMRHLGSSTYRPTYSYPVAKIAASHTLTSDLSLIYNAGFAYNGENADGFFIYSIMLSYSITPWCAVFGEAYGSFDHGNLPNHRIDGGFTFPVRNNLQLDISGGTGFDRTIDKSFISTGISWRIPR